LSKAALLNSYDNNPKIIQLSEALQQEGHKIQLNGLIGSSLSFVVQSLFKKSEKPFLLLFNDKEEAAYYLNDLEQLIGEKNVLFTLVPIAVLIK